MLKVRIQYTQSDEMKAAVEALEKEFEVISITEEAKRNNPKYKDSKYKMAYLDIERKTT